MGNRVPYVRPILDRINIERDFFDHNIFEKSNCYGPITDGAIPITLGQSEISELNNSNTKLKIIHSDYGYIHVKVKLDADIILKWFVYIIMNNKPLKFSCKQKILDEHMDFIQFKLSKLGYTLVSQVDEVHYELRKIESETLKN